MKITLGQIRVFSNSPKKNFRQIEDVIVGNESSDLIVFPQLSLSGMFCGDRLLKSTVQDEFLQYNDLIRDLSVNSLIVFGNIYRFEGKLYNAVFVAHEGEWVCDPIIKNNLSPYELNYFSALSTDDGFEFMGEDIFVSFDKGVADQFTIVMGCDPFVKGASRSLHRGVYINPVGIQNTGSEVFIFDGGSFVSDGLGVASCNDLFEADTKSFDFTLIKGESTLSQYKTYHALVHALRYFDEENLAYGPKWIIGVSGGLDSSVSVALLVAAFGKDRVLGVNMPSEFTRDITKSNAQHLSDVLGFNLRTIPIGDMVLASVDSFDEVVAGLSYENVQARLRGHTLMTLSSLVNGVVVNNGNKIEVAFGYATLYGDAIGALAILGDLNKLEVGDLARDYNAIHGQEVIPVNLIPTLKDASVEWIFAPSAELAQDQFDPMKWAYHDYLVEYLLNNSVESLMELYLDGSIADISVGRFLGAYGLDVPEAFISDLEWVLRSMNIAVYKRVQSPPIVRVSARGFGNEIQAPLLVSDRYIELKNLILAK